MNQNSIQVFKQIVENIKRIFTITVQFIKNFIWFWKVTSQSYDKFGTEAVSSLKIGLEQYNHCILYI